MSKVLIFGNSGSGKSTLAKKYCLKNKAVHLDLDTIAWQQPESPDKPPMRMALCDSKQYIHNFITENENWVIEGCYADLLAMVTEQADEMIFLNLPVDACIQNAKQRPWEPHKYESKAAQDANLEMLINWISQYLERNDCFSEQAHIQLFNGFDGKKQMMTSNY
jgi:adenylate kinase family enzyme